MCLQWKELNEYYLQQKHSKSKGSYIYCPPYCKECTKKKSTQWQDDNRDKVREYFNDYLKENDKWIFYNRKLKKKRREEGYNQNYYENNKEKFKVYRLNREMHKTHNISQEEWESCKNYFNYRCAYCGLKVEEHWIVNKGISMLGDFHKEHVNHSGSNDLSNCVPACKSCNSSKHDFELEQWYESRTDIFSKERLEKIYKWLDKDYRSYFKIE